MVNLQTSISKISSTQVILKIKHSVQLKKYILAFTIVLTGTQAASAQADADNLPTRPTAERLVKEVATVADMPSKAQTGDAGHFSFNTGNAHGEAIVQTALQYLGARYRSGHSGPTAFDCSGFTSYVYGQESIAISRSSRTQFQEGKSIDEISDLQKGDLVFFGGSSGSRRVGHVGIVTEVDPAANRFKFVHAARTGVKVDDSSSAYYSRRYIGARRIVKE